MAHSYIWQLPEWPRLRVNEPDIAPLLATARHEQGKVVGLFRAIGFPEASDIERVIWTDEAVATAAIEGEALDLAAVRSSVVRRLGAADEPRVRVSRNIDGLLDVMQDATNAWQEPLDDDRLVRWQSALFPGGTSGLHRIAVGRYRDDPQPMQIVSGAIGREKVHYEAPPSSQVSDEMARFIAWWEESRPDEGGSTDGLIRAALSHVWFETIHPFEDGNGRVGRALVDMALAQDAASPRRLYSLSHQLLEDKDAYYDALNSAQRGTLDATAWVRFFLEQFAEACRASQKVIEEALEKNRFWASHAQHDLNERQRKVMRRLLDAGKQGFEGGMSAEKYASIAGVSKATATRDLGDLARRGLLIVTSQGRGTRYWPNLPGWAPPTPRP